MTFTVENDIPVPEALANRRSRQKEPGYLALTTLDTNQSLFLVGKSASAVTHYMRGQPTKAMREAGKRFVFEAATKDGMSGVRIWRTA